MLSKPNLARRMIGWLVEISEFDIRYEPKGVIKSQCLADFSAELTPLPTLSGGWTLYVDDSLNKTACGAGVVLEGSATSSWSKLSNSNFGRPITRPSTRPCSSG